MISFSGIDCCGKSTQIQLLKEYLNERKIKCSVVWSRGGYTPGIEFLKTLIPGNSRLTNEEHVIRSNRINSHPFRRKILLTISLIDLCIYYSIVLRMKEINKVIICDRYIWDTYIDFKMKYPDIAFEESLWWKVTLLTMVKPKKSFCMYITEEESMRRSTLKDEPFPEPIEIRRTRIKWYQQEMKNKRWSVCLDSSGNIEEIHQKLLDELGGIL